MRGRLSLIALCVFVLPAAAADIPPRKPGQWDMQINYSANAPAQSIKQCIDAATDQMMHTTSGRMGRETCSKREVSSADGKIVVDAVCAIAGKTYTSQTVITGSLDSAYTMKIASKTDGAAGKPVEVNMSMEAKWIGPCTGGLAAGDVIMPNGRKMNVRDMQNAQQGDAVPARTGSTPARR